ncbi:hypothetical protein niasHS_013821 [Heterodera schachtii]|uniref:Globin family profile domain-containing protein n=1 Tax=Heterodera schachtii TaxID=97005 RepID=A0ABD2IJ30_HETSC
MLSAGSSSPVRSQTLGSSISGNELHGLGAMVPYRRPSAGPETTSTSTSAAPITTTLARSSSSRRRHRRNSNSTQWRSNTYSGTDECCGSVELVGVGPPLEYGGKLSSAPAATILSLREAMRELARPQMQLCIGGGLSAPPSNCSSTLCVADGGQGGDLKQRRRSSGGSDGKHSSISPPSRQMALKQQKHQQQRMSTTKILLTADDAGGATMTTRSASVCYPPGAQQLSRRCSTTTRSGRLERSNSLIAGRGSSTLAFLPELNPQQVANLRRTWKHINTKGLYDIIRRSFRKVESAHSSVAMAFRQNAAAGGGTSSAPTAQADGTKHAVTENSAGSNGKVPPLPPQTKFCGVMEHSKYFMVLLNRIIDGDGNNHQQEDLERELKQIGARHVIVYKRFGVGVTEIERTGEALAEALFKLDGIRQSKEATKVWRVLIAKIIDHIVTGFTGELRSQRRRTSSALLSSAASALAAPLFEHNDNATVKRNSVPNPHKSVRSVASNEDDDVDNDSPPLPEPSTLSSSSTTVPTTSLLSANYHNRADERQRQSVGGDCFLRAELAGVVRRLSNL